jgi:hypothetical protein
VKWSAWRWIAILAIAAVYSLVGFYPYEWRTPFPENHAQWLPNGGLRFSAPGIAKTDEAPAWLDRVRDSHRLDLVLRVRPNSISQSGPARIFTISKDPFLRNLTLGQEHDRLVLRIRTPETDANGVPQRELPNVFAEAHWVEIFVSVSPGRLRVVINGETRLDDRLPQAPLAHFDMSYLLALGNELTGDRPWRGDMAQATVIADGVRVEYVDPARISISRRFHRFRHLPQLVPFRELNVEDDLVNVLGFVPCGVLVGWLVLERRRRLPLWSILPVIFLSFAIEVIQLWIPARYAAVEDLVLNTLGGALGLLIAGRIWRTPSRVGA